MHCAVHKQYLKRPYPLMCSSCEYGMSFDEKDELHAEVKKVTPLFLSSEQTGCCGSDVHAEELCPQARIINEGPVFRHRGPCEANVPGQRYLRFESYTKQVYVRPLDSVPGFLSLAKLKILHNLPDVPALH